MESNPPHHRLITRQIGCEYHIFLMTKGLTQFLMKSINESLKAHHDKRMWDKLIRRLKKNPQINRIILLEYRPIQIQLNLAYQAAMFQLFKKMFKHWLVADQTKVEVLILSKIIQVPQFQRKANYFKILPAKKSSKF